MFSRVQRVRRHCFITQPRPLIHQQQYSSINSLWRLHFTTRTFCQRLYPVHRDHLLKHQQPKQSNVPHRLKSSLQTIIRSSSRYGCPKRNIHISNNNGSFTFYIDVFFSLSLLILLPDFIYELQCGHRIRSMEYEVISKRYNLIFI